MNFKKKYSKHNKDLFRITFPASLAVILFPTCFVWTKECWREKFFHYFHLAGSLSVKFYSRDRKGKSAVPLTVDTFKWIRIRDSTNCNLSRWKQFLRAEIVEINLWNVKKLKFSRKTRALKFSGFSFRSSCSKMSDSMKLICFLCLPFLAATQH